MSRFVDDPKLPHSAHSRPSDLVVTPRRSFIETVSRASCSILRQPRSAERTFLPFATVAKVRLVLAQRRSAWTASGHSPQSRRPHRRTAEADIHARTKSESRSIETRGGERSFAAIGMALNQNCGSDYSNRDQEEAQAHWADIIIFRPGMPWLSSHCSDGRSQPKKRRSWRHRRLRHFEGIVLQARSDRCHDPVDISCLIGAL